MEYLSGKRKALGFGFFGAVAPPGNIQTKPRLTLSQRFTLASLVILVAGMVGIGRWVSQQIEGGVIHRTAATTALFVDSFVSPHLQELGQTGVLSAEQQQLLSELMQNTPLGKQIVAFKVWSPAGKVLFSTDLSAVGRTYPLREGQVLAVIGQVSSKISDLDEDENVAQRSIRSQLIETYSPVRLNGTGRVIAVAEFYQTLSELLFADDLQKEIAGARLETLSLRGGSVDYM